MQTAAFSFAVLHAKVPETEHILSRWLRAHELPTAWAETEGWIETAAGRHRLVSVEEPSAAWRLEWVLQGTEGSRHLILWRESTGEGMRYTLHMHEAPIAPELPAAATVEALGGTLAKAGLLETEDGKPLGQLRRPSQEQVDRLYRLLRDEKRTIPAVVMAHEEAARYLVEHFGWTAHVFLLDEEARVAFNQLVLGYHRLTEPQVVQVFGPHGAARWEHKRCRVNASHERAYAELAKHVHNHCMLRLVWHSRPPEVDEALEQSREQRAAAARVREADARLASLRQEVEARFAEGGQGFDTFVEEFTALEKALSAERAQSQDLFARNGKLHAENRALRSQLARQAAQADVPLKPADVEPWDFDAMEEVTNGAIVFTPNARETWRKVGHPHADLLWTSVIRLAEAAAVYREQEGKIGESLPQWLEERTGKECPTKDDGLVKRGLDRFMFEGASYSRLPHVKVTDSKSFPEVARIYFADEKEALRFVVDHVGEKLYNPNGK